MPIATGTAEVRRSPDDPDGVTLLVNGVPSSHLDLSDPLRLEFEYMQQMAAVLDRTAARTTLPPPGARAPGTRPVGDGAPGDGTRTAAPLRVTHLGAAGCALARWVDATHPGSRQVAVDLDPVLVALVREWFDLPRAPALRLRTGDARAELATLPDGGADAVVRDVFAGDRTPAHVGTLEFVQDVARALRPGGVYLANCADRPPLDHARDEVATLAAVFGHVGLVAEPGVLRGRRYGNLVLVGTDDPAVLTDASLARELRSLPVPARLLTGDELRSFAGRHVPLRDPAPEVGTPAVG